MGEKQTIQGGAAWVLQVYLWRKVSKTCPVETSRHRLFFTKEGKGRIVILSQKQTSV